MKFVFINPSRNFFKKNVWKLINSVTPPIGIAILAAVLERAGIESDLIDAVALNLNEDQILDKIDPQADYVGISATTPEIDVVLNLAGNIAKRFPQIQIILGGVHPTIFQESLVEGRFCDLVIRGEGETPILELAKKKPIETICNLTWRSSDGKVIVNPMSETFIDLDTLPVPAYHKLPMEKYHSALGAAKYQPSIGMITSRGCPGACTFCFSGMFGRKIRFLSFPKILEQIDLLQTSYGIREISFYDDTFTADRKRVQDLCEGLIQRKKKLSWSCFARVDTVNKDLLMVMKHAGCHQIMYGFESADETVLKTINKRIALRQVKEVVNWTEDAGIDIRGAFMFGNPGETEGHLKKTIEYAISLGIQYAIFNITTPFPGTSLFNWAEENNLLRHTDWQSYDLSHAILSIPGLPYQTIESYYQKAFSSFYFRPRYLLERLFAKHTKFETKSYFKAFSGLLLQMISARY
ncbi:MAG: cobalamin-dependent protein [Candidatus Riflebacteria bacterium]|nr:cobalamin-dependent protein [Candidatus Riflebacteria bacterium]